MNEQPKARSTWTAELDNLDHEIGVLRDEVSLQDRGVQFFYAVDFLEIYEYLHPFANAVARKLPIEDALATYLAVCHLFENLQEPLVLLPPYQLELENHMQGLKRSLYDVALASVAIARETLAADAAILKSDPQLPAVEKAARALQAVDPSEYFTFPNATHAQLVLDYVSSNARRLFLLLVIEALGEPDTVNKRLERLLNQRLVSVPNGWRELVDKKTLEHLCNSHLTHVFLNRLDARRGNSYANKIDAVAGTLLAELNRDGRRNNRVLVLYTHAQVMHNELGGDLTRTFDSGSVSLSLLRHPVCLPTKALHSWDGNLRDNLEASAKWLSALKSSVLLAEVVPGLDEGLAERLDVSLKELAAEARLELLPRMRTLANLSVAAARDRGLAAPLGTFRGAAGQMTHLALDVLQVLQAPEMRSRVLKRLEETATSLVRKWQEAQLSAIDSIPMKLGEADSWRTLGVLVGPTQRSLRIASSEEDLYPYQFVRFASPSLDSVALQLVGDEPNWDAARAAVGRSLADALREAAEAPPEEQLLFVAYLSFLTEPGETTELDRMLSKSLSASRAANDRAFNAECRFLRCITLRLRGQYEDALPDSEAALAVRPKDPRFCKEAAVIRWHLAAKAMDCGNHELSSSHRRAALQFTSTAAAASELGRDPCLAVQVLANLVYFCLEEYKRTRVITDLQRARSTMERIELAHPEGKWYPEVFLLRGALKLESMRAAPGPSPNREVCDRIRADLVRAELGATSPGDRDWATALLNEVDALMEPRSSDVS